MIEKETAGTLVAGALIGLTIFGDWLAKWWEKSHPAKKADELAKATLDLDRVLSDREHAHKAEVDQYEARELNLTAEKAELMRQGAENSRLYAQALKQLTEDRDADRIEIRALRDRVGGLVEDVEEGKRKHEGCEARLIAFQASLEQAQREHRDILNAMTNQLADRDAEIEQKDRRGYRTAKAAEKAVGDKGAFTATDVWPDGKPLP